MPERGQPAECKGEIKDPRARALGGVKRDGLDRAGQNRLHQITQHMTGADFDEGAHAIGVHRFNLAHEIDRLHNLVSEQLACVFFSLGILRTGGVGIHRQFALGELHLFERSGEGCARVRYQRAVKRCRYLQHAIADRACRQGRCRAFNLLGRSCEHKLFRRVAVGDHQTADRTVCFLA